MKRLTTTVAIIMLFSTLLFASAQVPSGMVIMKSNNNFNQTFRKLRDAIDASPLTLIQVINHQQNAENNGLELLPTRVILFGNPMIGTPLMQAYPSIAIDLPQKMLVWQTEDGSVFVGFNSPYYLGARHNLEGQEETLMRINTVLTNLATAATQ